MKLTRVERIEVYPNGTDEEKKVFYKYFNKNSKLYVNALNKIYSQLYAESILQNDISFLDEGYADRLKAIEKKIEELKSEKNSDSKLDKEFKKLNKLRNAKNAEARKIFDEAIGLSSGTRTRDLGKKFNFDYSDFVDSANQKAMQDFKNDYVELISGKRSARNYRWNYKKSRLPYRGRDVRVYENDDKFYVKLPQGIQLSVYLGRYPSKSYRVKRTLQDIVAGEVKLGQSFLIHNNGKFYLNLVVQFEKDNKNINLEPNKTLVVEYTDNAEGFLSIGSKKILEFGDAKRIRTFKIRMKSLRSKEQSRSILGKGGHGRKRKLPHERLEAIRTRESNFAKTYNNQVSRQIVRCAVINRCATISVNPLTEELLDKEWSYFQLHELLKQKAIEYNIDVKIN